MWDRRIDGRWPMLLLAMALVATTGSGCIQRTCDVDGNGEYAKAMRASPSVLVKDEVGAKCDNVDWRFVSNFEDANATLIFRVGDPFKGHKAEGTIALYDVDAQLLDQAAIRPNESKYEFRFPVRARKQYFIKVESTTGVAEYTLETKFESTDPCAKCGPEQDCIQGKCVAKVKAVVEPSCKGVCPEGYVCDEVQNKCVRLPCGGPCPSNMTCDEDKDQCVKQWKPECKKDGDCKGSKVCQKGRCKVKETAKTDTPTETVEAPTEEGPTYISAIITSVIPTNKGLILILSRGGAAGLKNGKTGTITGAGAGCTIFDVNPNRSKCKTSIDKTKLGTAKKVTFKVD